MASVVAERPVTERERFDFEKGARERELDIRRDESRRARWSNPLVLAILTAALAAAGSALVSRLNSSAQEQLERTKAEQSLIQAMVRNDNVKQNLANLDFLVKTNLIRDADRRSAISRYIEKTRADPASGGVSAPESESRSRPSGDQHYDFPILNAKPIDPAGWEVDVFSCAATGPRFDRASALAAALADRADGAQRLGGQKLGRIRFTSGTAWGTDDAIVFDPAERSFADVVAAFARQQAKLDFVTRANGAGASPTNFYLSIFFCGR